ncbi:MAG: UvrD-helicase domain-containing protein [Bacteroidales bacterium]|nr:UvrD-helicase domain-containing protein [Bacteroidales bacterium]MCF8350172.1 UvrD-helicase domain-containing protein [Bacteroidales bacterium]MCF8375059.1 UvrD-helicase domain-containing protein [Bacteroidales bacterium]MCF8399965.1 UvrD-helicase domain-containing protein [Bacteroidales bacterium]
MANFLKQLNEVQQQAVMQTEGPVMVIAGAGSGKTRVLTYRVAYLLTKGADPFNILALTFTNKAAREMKERIIKLIGSTEGKNVWMGTFHSIFARILRVEGHHLGYPQNYSIYDTDDSKRLIKSIIKEQNLNDKVYAPNYVLGRISGAKSGLVSVAEYNQNPEVKASDESAGKPKIGELYKIYQGRLKKAQAMDFDDLLFNMYILLRDFPDLLYKYQQRFKYILVDEYQDTNHAQYMIVKKLAANNENLCIVGDDAQSIYGFRGANIQNILNFRSDYPDHKVFKLEQNYRSTKTIVGAANGIIVNNKNQIFKEIWTENEEGNKINILKASSDNEEGGMVANSIFEHKMNFQLKNNEFAVLYRTNAQSRSIEEALRRRNIPYRIFGGLSFYNRKEVKDLLAYFRLVINHKDEEALMRVINYPARGIGKTTLEKLIVEADRVNKSVWEAAEKLEVSNPGLNAGTRRKIIEFTTMIKSFKAQVGKKNAYDLAKHIATSSGLLRQLYEDKSPEGVSRFENIEELLNAIKEFTEQERTLQTEEETEEKNSIRTLDEFLQEVALLTDQDKNDKNSTDYVSLMTIHMAKGLEFPYVFLVGLEENLFPSIQSLSARADLEEERRLFYVALTRAMKKITLSYAETRYKWGNLTICEPSRFLEEVDEKYIEAPRKASIHKSDFFESGPKIRTTSSGDKEKVKRKNFRRVSSVSPEPSHGGMDHSELQTGMEVEHRKFGRGKIVHLEGDGANKKATVFFKGVGNKQLLLKFAKLKVLK